MVQKLHMSLQEANKMIKASPAPLDNAFDKVQNDRARMVFGQNDRMAGSVPVFEKGGSFAAEIAEMDSKGADSSIITALTEDNMGKDKANSRDSEFGFLDFLDIINPLQHIPLVSTIYQHVTGDMIKPAANILGGALFGGPLGAAGSIATTVASEIISDKNTIAQRVALKDSTVIAFADLWQGLTPYNSWLFVGYNNFKTVFSGKLLVAAK